MRNHVNKIFFPVVLSILSSGVYSQYSYAQSLTQQSDQQIDTEPATQPPPDPLLSSDPPKTAFPVLPEPAQVPDVEVLKHTGFAPTSDAEQQQLLHITVNGESSGDFLVDVKGSKITLSSQVLTSLRIKNNGKSLDLDQDPGIKITSFDPSKGILNIRIPLDRLDVLSLSSGVAPEIRLSPETWGGFINYNLNLRHTFLGNTAAHTSEVGQNSGVDWGGQFDLNLLAPDFLFHNGIAYDSSRGRQESTVRLDTTLTWRPSDQDISVSFGDVVSNYDSATRPFRNLGFFIGSDYTRQPGWNSSPFVSIGGTAQAQSAIDLYVNGQRSVSTTTSGGNFNLNLPQGLASTGTRLVITDVSGKTTIIPIDAPVIDAPVIKEGLFLWSAGMGIPRFSYGSLSNDYQAEPYSYGSAKWGVTNKLTATSHIEGGQRVQVLEIGANAIVHPRIAVKAGVAASHSARGIGGSSTLGLAVVAPWGLSFDLLASKTLGNFDDVVSVSGRRYAQTHHISNFLSQPPSSTWSARIGWNVIDNLNLAASYQQYSYPGNSSVGFASFTANYNLLNKYPIFLNVNKALSGTKELTILAGISLNLGANTQANLSTGFQSGGMYGSVDAGHTMDIEPGSYGWRVVANRSAQTSFYSAGGEWRTGLGIPGATVQRIGGTTTAYATTRGSLGYVGNHPFVSDPVEGGIIIADAGAPGVGITLNGYNQGRTSWDGKLAITNPIAGTPQRVELDLEQMPIELMPQQTFATPTIRSGGATSVNFGIRSIDSGASLKVVYDGKPPPVGSSLISSAGEVPLDKLGNGYLASIEKNEILKVRTPSGQTCSFPTGFDGNGGPSRKLGVFQCK